MKKIVNNSFPPLPPFRYFSTRKFVYFRLLGGGAVLDPLDHSSRSARPHCSLRRLRRPFFTYFFLIKQLIWNFLLLGTDNTEKFYYNSCHLIFLFFFCRLSLSGILERKKNNFCRNLRGCLIGSLPLENSLGKYHLTPF